MSIADKITQLTNIRAAIRTALQNKGIAAAVSHNFSDFAADIAAIVTGVTLQSKRVSASTSGVTVVTPDSGYDGLSEVRVNMILRQAKTATPGASQQVISPDSGYQGLSQVTVEGDADLVPANIKSGVDIFGVTGSYAPASVNLQSKSVTPTASAQTVTPDSGYDGLSQVSVAAAPLETKSVTPTAAAQTITPSSGKIGMSQVTVAATPLESKSVTPGTTQQTVTPSSGKVGLSSVIVAGDADLVAANIKSGIQIFGVTGTYAPAAEPIPGSLIEITCSTDIDEVKAVVNGNTYTAYLNTTTHKAYVVIPYTDTTASRTCNLYGYVSGSQVAQSALTMGAGIGYYTGTLQTTAYLYNAGTWYGLSSHEWNQTTGDQWLEVVVEDPYLQFNAVQASTGTYPMTYLTPAVSSGGHATMEIEVPYIGTGNMFSIALATQYYGNPFAEQALSVGTNTITIPTAYVNTSFYLRFHSRKGSSTNLVGRISSIKFV